MKKIKKNAYSEGRYGRGTLWFVAVLVTIISIVMVAGGVWLFVKGCAIGGLWSTIWRVTVGGILALLGVVFGFVAIMMYFTAKSMIKVGDGNVSDIGNSAVGTINIVKCNKCGEKLDYDSTFCTKCGAEIDGAVKCKCGTVNLIDGEYCKKCGKKLK